MEFIDAPGFLQVVLSERAINCALRAIKTSKLSSAWLSTTKIQNSLNRTNLNIDVSTISQFISEFEDLFTQNQPLDIQITLEDCQIDFQEKPFSVYRKVPQITLNSTLVVQIRL
jgi:hypothetical protein